MTVYTIRSNLDKKPPLEGIIKKTSNIEKVEKIRAGLKPITLVYNDSEGRSIQLWKSVQYGLIGTVVKQDGDLVIIPAERVRNVLNPEQSSAKLLESLENYFGCLWDIVYDTRQIALTIWPHMVAAGTPDLRPLINKKLEHLQTAQKKAVKKETLPDGRIRYYGKEEPANKSGPTRGAGRVTEYNPKTGSVRSWYASFDESGKVIRVHPKHINGRDVNKPHYPPTGKELAQSKAAAVRASPSKHFTQTLQQTRLTKSYNSTNPQNPISAKGGAAGEIGGVACSIDYIQGLFDEFELNNQLHYFYMSVRDNALPFSDHQLKQIIREIAIGVYKYSTVPFFSLHFNQDGEMFPVIHPAFDNTLVGRVIALLDYTMKGYLNGGIFKDSFVDDWAKNPSWKAKKTTAMEQLIDFTDYCREQMSGMDKIYLSTDELGAFQSIIDERDPNEPEIFSDYTQFTNSFRIISKQKGWQKHDNILVINSDFDVSYTILPNATYRKALEGYYKEKGHYPKSYLKLKDIFEAMKDRIHDHMAKFPLRKEYFAMLGFIGYFASYFSTLKKHRKVPILPPIERATYTSPALFPHLPKKVKEKIALDCNLNRLLQSLSSSEKESVQRYADQCTTPGLHPNAKNALESILKTQMIAEIKKNLNESKRVAFQKALSQENLNQLINKWVNQLLTVINALCSKLKTEKEEALKFKEQMVQRKYVLSQREIEEVNECNKIRTDLMSKRSEFRTTLNSYPKYTYKGTEDLKPESRAALNENIRKIDEALSKIPEDPEKTLRKDKLKAVNEFILGIENKQRNIHKITLEFLPDKTEHMAEFPAFFLSLKDDMSQEALIKGQRLLGGCGFHLQEGHVMPSPLAKSVQLSHTATLASINQETWKLLSDESGKGALFSLSYQSIPAGIEEDFHWMENSLMEGKGPDFWSNWQKALLSLSRPTPEELLNLVQEVPSLLKEKDYEGRTLLHLAAQGENPAFVTELIKKGLSLSAEDHQGNLPIHFAAAKGKCLATLIEADKQRKTINAENKNKETPLHIAIQEGLLNHVQALADNGAKNSYSHTGYNTLHTALHHGYEEIALFLLDNKIVALSDVNSLAEEGGTPLMMACEMRSLMLVQKLVAVGANISIARKDGVTTIEISILMDEIPILDYLLSLGKPSDQALETAAKEGSAKVYLSLSKLKEFFQYRNSWKDSIFHIAIRAGNITPLTPHLNRLPATIYEEQNKKGETIRQLVIQGGYWDLLPQLTSNKKLSVKEIHDLLIHPYNLTLKELLQGINLSVQEREMLIKRAAVVGNTMAIPLFLLPGQILKEEFISSLVKWDSIYLLRSHFGSKLNITDVPSLIGQAAAHGSLKVISYLVEKAKRAGLPYNPAWMRLAVSSDQVEALQLVLSLSPDPKSSATDPNEAPLHYAASRGCKKMVEYLLNLGVPVDALDKNQKSALFYALKANEESVVKFLIKKQAKWDAPEVYQAACASQQIWTLALSSAPSVDVRSLQGDTPLILAVDKENAKGVANLLQAGANRKLPGKGGVTPICLAAAKGSYECVSLLLSGEVDKEPFQGKNALHWASLNGHPHVVKLLLSHGFAADNKTKELAKNHPAVLDELGEGVLEYRESLQSFRSELEMISFMTKPNLNQLIEKLLQLPLNTQICYEKNAATPLQCLLIKLLELKKIPMQITWLKTIVDHLISEGIPKLIGMGLNPNMTDSDGDSIAHTLILLGGNPRSIPQIDLFLPNKNGVTPLHIAALEAHADFFDGIKNGANVEDKSGETPLFYALKGNKPENIRQLLIHKANPNHRNGANLTPLSMAIAKESLQCVHLLVKGGAAVNQPVLGNHLTPLYMAAFQGNLEISRYLLDNGADPKMGDRQEKLPIHIAAEKGDLPLFRLLAERGSPLEYATKKGILPVHIAAHGGHVSILQQLHIQGASLHAPTQKDPKRPEAPERIALHFAIGQGQLDAMRFLVDKAGMIKEEEQSEEFSVLAAGASSAPALSSLRTYRFSENPELLKQAAICSIIHDNRESLRIITEWGITPTTNLGHGMLLLHFASLHGAIQSTSLLIEQGANPLIPDNEGETALEVAAKNSSFEQFDALLEYCTYLPEFTIDAKNSRGETLLHLAAKAGNISHLATLIWQGASLSEENVQQATPLDEALRIYSYTEEGKFKQKLVETIRFLFICGAEMDQKYSEHPLIETFKAKFQEGDTPLHAAVLLQDKAALDLFAKMMDVDEKNKEGSTPLHCAAVIGDEAAVITLLKAGAKKEISDAKGHTAALLAKNPVLKRLLT